MDTAILQQLADQLGVAVPYLWEVLIRQAPITGVSYLVSLILLDTGAVVASCILLKKATNEDQAWDNPVIFVAVLVVGIVDLIAVGMTMEYSSQIVYTFLNPEYWALSQLQMLIK